MATFFLSSLLKNDANILLNSIEEYGYFIETALQERGKKTPVSEETLKRIRDFLTLLIDGKADADIFAALNRNSDEGYLIHILVAINISGKGLLGFSFLSHLFKGLKQLSLQQNVQNLLMNPDRADRNVVQLMVLSSQSLDDLQTTEAILGKRLKEALSHANVEGWTSLHYAANYSPSALVWVLKHSSPQMLSAETKHGYSPLKLLRAHKKTNISVLKIDTDLYQELLLLMRVISGEMNFTIDELQSLVLNKEYLTLLLKFVSPERWSVILGREAVLRFENSEIRNALQEHANSSNLYAVEAGNIVNAENQHQNTLHPRSLSIALSPYASILLQNLKKYCRYVDISRDKIGQEKQVRDEVTDKIREFLSLLTEGKTNADIIAALKEKCFSSAVIHWLVNFDDSGKNLLGDNSFLSLLLEGLQHPALQEDAKKVLLELDAFQLNVVQRVLTRAQTLDELEQMQAILGEDISAVLSNRTSELDDSQTGLHYAARYSPLALLWVLKYIPCERVLDKTKNGSSVLDFLQIYKTHDFPSPKIPVDQYQEIFLLLRIISGEMIFTVEELQNLTQNEEYLTLLLRFLSVEKWTMILEREKQESKHIMIRQMLVDAEENNVYRAKAKEIVNKDREYEESRIHPQSLAIALGASAHVLLLNLEEYCQFIEVGGSKVGQKIQMNDESIAQIRHFLTLLVAGQNNDAVLEGLLKYSCGNSILHWLISLNESGKSLLGSVSFLSLLLKGLQYLDLQEDAKKKLLTYDVQQRNMIERILIFVRSYSQEELVQAEALWGQDIIRMLLCNTTEKNQWKALHICARYSPMALTWVLKHLPVENVFDKTEKGYAALKFLRKYKTNENPAPKIDDKLYHELLLLLRIVSGEMNFTIKEFQGLVSNEEYLTLVLKFLSIERWTMILLRERQESPKRKVIWVMLGDAEENNAYKEKTNEIIYKDSEYNESPLHPQSLASALSASASILLKNIHTYIEFVDSHGVKEKAPKQVLQKLSDFLITLTEGKSDSVILAGLFERSKGFTVLHMLVTFNRSGKTLLNGVSFLAQLLKALQAESLQSEAKKLFLEKDPCERNIIMIMLLSCDIPLDELLLVENILGRDIRNVLYMSKDEDNWTALHFAARYSPAALPWLLLNLPFDHLFLRTKKGSLAITLLAKYWESNYPHPESQKLTQEEYDGVYALLQFCFGRSEIASNKLIGFLRNKQALNENMPWDCFSKYIINKANDNTEIESLLLILLEYLRMYIIETFECEPRDDIGTGTRELIQYLAGSLDVDISKIKVSLSNICEARINRHNLKNSIWSSSGSLSDRELAEDRLFDAIRSLAPPSLTMAPIIPAADLEKKSSQVSSERQTSLFYYFKIIGDDNAAPEEVQRHSLLSSGNDNDVELDVFSRPTGDISDEDEYEFDEELTARDEGIPLTNISPPKPKIGTGAAFSPGGATV